MERRRKQTASNPRGRLDKDAATNASTSNLPDLPYINEIIELCGITIGIIPPVGECVAVAHQGRNTLAMLVRRKGETLAQLLTRLDLAIARAQTEDIFTDEINRRQNSNVPSSRIPSTQDGQKRTLTEGAKGDVLLEVALDMGEDDFAACEWPEEGRAPWLNGTTLLVRVIGWRWSQLSRRAW